ncbi:hypothetical protein [Glaciihabitans sp. dw_435]|uniref:hypothetical protein n=1 Tax=Glaciihabitans sp. dw_435 TaxID=2720081 RepID=UPI001BD5117A|nr:hypothetical protein [Glaciihabitans sp. dw_435]
MMLTQTSTPGTDDWWVMQLATDFGNDLPRLHKLQSYADGTNALPDEGDAGMKEAYRRFIHMSRLNMADLIVSTKVARMKPQGFRTAAPGDTDGDAAAYAMWKRSSMKVGVRDFLTDAGVLGAAYLTTTGPQNPSPQAEPLILPSNGFTTVTRQYALRPWLAEASMQVGHDPVNGVDILTLFRDGTMRQAMRQAEKRSSIPSNGSRWQPGRGWQWVSDPLQLGYTDTNPIFKLSGPGGMGMFEKHTDSLDRLTNRIRDGLTISAMQAFRQRGIEGSLPQFYPEGHAKAGQKIDYNEMYKAGPAALWMLPLGAKVWESAVTDITPILTATKDDAKHVAAVTSTPIYILSPDAANASAEGAKAGGEAFMDSVEEWMERGEIPIVQSLSTGFAAMGDTVRSAVGEIEVIWAPVARTSTQEKSSSASQAKAGGLPQLLIDEKIWGLTPAEIAQARQARSDEAFETALS